MRQNLLIIFIICISSGSILAQNKPLIINGGIVNGKAKTLPTPEYPTNLTFTPKNKVVKVRAIIDLFSGKVISVKAFSGNRVFWQSAEDAAKLAIFSPSNVNGEPVLVRGIIVYKFVPPKTEKDIRTGPCGGGVINSKAIKLVQPIFPKVQPRVSGQVTVQVTIDENGDVVDAEACSGNPLLRKSAVEAARQSKFSQTKLSGVPVKVRGTVIYNYTQSKNRKERSKLASCPEGLMINGGVLNGKALNFVQPEYPKNKTRASGQVSVQVVVDENGNVSSAVACSGSLLFRKSAVEAAKRLKFSQTMLSGVPVKVSAAVVYNFVPPNAKKEVSKFPPCPSGPLGGGVINGKATNLIQPEYPEEARKTRASGQVSVQALIDENGKVISATAVSGNPLLRSSAMGATRKSIFRPQIDCHGNAVKVSGTIIYNFTPPNEERQSVVENPEQPCALENRQKTVSLGILNQKAFHLETPEYPKVATDNHVSGQVSVEILVDENGNVASAKAISGNPLLRVSAMEAARKSTFEPLKLSGCPVRFYGTIVSNFVPPENSSGMKLQMRMISPDEIFRCSDKLNQSTQKFNLNEKAIKLVQPEFPKTQGLVSGKTAVQALIGEQGNVVSAIAISGNLLLYNPAIEAARKSTFKMYVDCDGNVSKYSGIIIYNFIAQ